MRLDKNSRKSNLLKHLMKQSDSINYILGFNFQFNINIQNGLFI